MTDVSRDINHPPPGVLARRGLSWGVLLAAGLWAVLVVSAMMVQSIDPASSRTTCIFKNLTGAPCPTCGSTRAALRLMHLDLPGALAQNPLMTLVMLGVPCWILWRLALARLRGPSAATGLTMSWNLVAFVLVALVACNWAYVILTAR